MAKGEVLIVLSNLGGPSSLNEVEPFLLSLLSDPNVIRLPWFIKPLQPWLAKLIVKRRLPQSQQLYRDIGGKSPLVAIAQQQAAALSRVLDMPVAVYMDHSKPSIPSLRQTILEMRPHLRKLMLLPLYPQYSTTTTKTSIERVGSLVANEFPEVQFLHIGSFPDDELFVQSWVERIKNRLVHLPAHTELLFSAHGIPKSYAEDGDPYPAELARSVQAIMKYFPERVHRLTFQSRFGPSEWLRPYTDDVLRELPQGSEVLVIPISFVSDHVETIHEIGIEFKHIAEERGIKLHRTPGLNVSRKFIDCLAGLVRANLNLK